MQNLKVGADLVPDQNDMTGNLEDWEDRVFQNTDHFRVHRYYGRGASDQFETKDFGQAMVAADEVLKTSPSHRVIVYSVTAAGRYFAIPQKRWNHYAELWIKMKSKNK